MLHKFIHAHRNSDSCKTQDNV